jgi:hypothetical protein
MWREVKKVTAHGGRWELVAIRGTVKEAAVGTETHVRSSGGGGVITPHGGTVEAPTVTSEVKYRTRARLTDPASGRQADVVLDTEVHLSPGDDVEVFGYRVRDQVHPLRVANRTTGAVTGTLAREGAWAWNLGHPFVRFFSLQGPLRVFGLFLFGGLIFAATAYLFRGPGKVGQDAPMAFGLAAVAAAVYLMWVAWYFVRTLRAAAKLDQHAIAAATAAVTADPR